VVNEGAVFIRGTDDPDGPWRKVGTTVGTPLFTGGERLMEVARDMEEAMQKLARGFTLNFTTSFPPGRMRQLHRLLIAPDDRRCYTCMRRFPGPWQRSKHERKAHRG
jgi:hypothetical protein